MNIIEGQETDKTTTMMTKLLFIPLKRISAISTIISAILSATKACLGAAMPYGAQKVHHQRTLE